MNNYRSKFFVKIFTVLFLIGCSTTNLLAQLSVSQIFGNGMVLQREHTIPVWGKSTASSSVTVTIAGNSQTVNADNSGNWKVELPAMAAGGPYLLSISSGSQQLSRTDVYIGDVWLASGQSNMELALSGTEGAASVISSSNDQKIRQFKVPKGLANDPSDDLPSGSAWTPATSQYVGNFSAVGYYFAFYLKQDLNIPIGIINTSYGGSRIETWMSKEMLGYDEQDIKLANGEPERQPTVAFNKMLYPLLKFPIKGVIWYQAESNGDNMNDAMAYGELFKTMITGWRSLWNEGNIPFLWVQLPNYGTVYDEPQVWDAWPQLRAQQSSALDLPITGEAVTIDVGAVDIHPTKKQPVGYRLSLVARKVAYNEDIVYSGPRYVSNLLRDDGKIEINLKDIGSGLKANGTENGIINGFAVAGSDNNLAWAKAVIEGNKVVVWNDNIAKPEIVRYAWEYNPSTANLYNTEDLPAAPFLANVNPGFKIAKFTAARTTIETGQSTTLSWLVYGSSSVTLDGTLVDSSSSKTITPTASTTYTLIAVNRDDINKKDTAKVTVEVLDPNQINRALNHTVTASTYEACCGTERVPGFAVDGDFTTRWSSAWQQENATTIADPNLDDNPDDEWITVDLGESIDIDRVILYWETAYASEYNIEMSYDNYIWHSVYEELSGNGGDDNIVFSTPVSGRYLRVHCLNRASQFGYSLYEISAYGMLSAKKPPTVGVTTNFGNVTQPNKKASIIASATDSDGTIQKAEFFVDGKPIGVDNTSPFQIDWTPDKKGHYNLTSIVTDNDGLSVQSDSLKVYVIDNSSLTKFEAEKGVYTGQGNILSLAAASGGKYMELRDAWTLTFSGIQAHETGNYLLIMSYQLTFESPKTQYLVVNGDTVEAVEFTAPDKTLWLQRGIMIPLKSGSNEISIRGFWNWMSFDFIAIEGLTPVSVKDKYEIPPSFSLNQNYPNPFNPSTIIKFSIPVSNYVTLKIYDVLGKEVKTLISKNINAGSYTTEWDGYNNYGNRASSGIYVYRLVANNFVASKKMILIK